MNMRNCIAGGVLIVLAVSLRPCVAANKIYEALVEHGVTLSPQETISLPKPILADGLDAAQQQHAIEGVLAGRYDWESFTRKAVVSPFLLKISDEGRDAGKIGRRVDLYFVAYGSLNKLGNDTFLQDHLNLTASDQGSENPHVKVLTDDELSSRGLPTGQTIDNQRWVFVESTLLGKVLINLTTQNAITTTNDSVLVASIADRRFEKDAEHPNSWRSITIDDAGHREIGAPAPYSGLGSYVKATQLAQPVGAIFLEYHVLFAEPQGWFHGANLLQSKLPIVSQDMVRRFRRSMAEQ
jgi:hypothetical protein